MGAFEVRSGILGVISQLLFSATSLLTGLVAAMLLDAEGVAQIALVTASSMFMATLLNSFALTPLSLTLPKVKGQARSLHVRNVYQTIIIFATLSIFILALGAFFAMLPGMASIAGAAYALSLMLRHQQRLKALAESEGTRAFIGEAVNFLGLIVCVAFIAISGARPDAPTLLFLLAAASLPSLMMALLTRRGTKAVPILHRTVAVRWRAIWRKMGVYMLPGIVLSELLLNGHVYLLSFFAQASILADIYIASLIFRPVSILVVGVNATLRPHYVRWLANGEERRVERVSVGLALAMVAACAVTAAIGLLGAEYVMARWMEGDYQLDNVRAAIVVCAVFYAFQTVRMPFTTALQAIWDFRFNLLTLALSVGIAATCAAVAWLVLGMRDSAYAMMISGQAAFTLLTLSRYAFVRIRRKRALPAARIPEGVRDDR